MSSKYLLPCTCGQKLEVDRTQSGLTLRCDACGANITVPPYRDLERLEKVAQQPRPTTPAEQLNWGPMHALLLVGGVIALVGGLSLGYVALTPPAPPPPDVADYHTREELELHTVLDTWMLWEDIRQPLLAGQNVYFDPGYLSQMKEHRQWLAVAGSVIGLGLVVAGIGMVIEPSKSKPAPRPPEY